jgi:hypothetical protein
MAAFLLLSRSRLRFPQLMYCLLGVVLSGIRQVLQLRLQLRFLGGKACKGVRSLDRTPLLFADPFVNFCKLSGAIGARFRSLLVPHQFQHLPPQRSHPIQHHLDRRHRHHDEILV